ncbi:hypothetical protein LINPERHAP1_LOCUS14457 [Linum perenne]
MGPSIVTRIPQQLVV